MKRFRLFFSTIAIVLMVGVMGFAVYAATTTTLIELEGRNINFTVSDDVFFDAKITYSWDAESTITFGVNTTTGLLNADNIFETDTNNYLALDVPASIDFQDASTEYTVKYLITNTGEKSLRFVISGLVFDTVNPARFSTSINDESSRKTAVSTETIIAGVTIYNGTFSVETTIEPNTTKEIAVFYKLERLNATVDNIQENISLEFSTVAV